jgi:hypothetical protein
MRITPKRQQRLIREETITTITIWGCEDGWNKKTGDTEKVYRKEVSKIEV